MEITVAQTLWLLVGMGLVFLAGLCWCFCCGTCIGRSLLRNTGLVNFTRDGDDHRQWRHLPHQMEEDEETWHLQLWNEEDELEQDTNI